MRLRITHSRFSILFCTLLYVACNAVNLERLTRWFQGPQGLNLTAFLAYFIAGLLLFTAVFALLAHRHTVKPLAISLIVVSAFAAYFVAKYDVAVDSSMLQNVVHTDAIEVRQLLSWRMLPIVALSIPAILLVLLTDIRFEGGIRYPMRSLGLAASATALAAIALYANFNAIQRAGNVSNKYIVWSLVPVNVLWSSLSLAAESARPLIVTRRNPDELHARVTRKGNLLVVLAIGESSRRASFSLYGYKRRETNPELREVPDLHLLDGVAARASTIRALPQILEKDGFKLPTVTMDAGIPAACLVNFTLYDNCDSVGEVAPTRCAHGGRCFDEDVLPLLRDHLRSTHPASELVVLHFGGGSHGPLYRDRHPPEYQRFQPVCRDADVATGCSREELFNSYDNTILYVDHVLGATVRLLKQSARPYVLIYVSDHGESLMENGVMFHGVPPGVPLPKEQREVPLIVESSEPLEIRSRPEYSQPDIFDSILDLLSIESPVLNARNGFIRLKSRT